MQCFTRGLEKPLNSSSLCRFLSPTPARPTYSSRAASLSVKGVRMSMLFSDRMIELRRWNCDCFFSVLSRPVAHIQFFFVCFLWITAAQGHYKHHELLKGNHLVSFLLGDPFLFCSTGPCFMPSNQALYLHHASLNNLQTVEICKFHSSPLYIIWQITLLVYVSDKLMNWYSSDACINVSVTAVSHMRGLNLILGPNFSTFLLSNYSFILIYDAPKTNVKQ